MIVSIKSSLKFRARAGSFIDLSLCRLNGIPPLWYGDADAPAEGNAESRSRLLGRSLAGLLPAASDISGLSSPLALQHSLSVVDGLNFDHISTIDMVAIGVDQ